MAGLYDWWCNWQLLLPTVSFAVNGSCRRRGGYCFLLFCCCTWKTLNYKWTNWKLSIGGGGSTPLMAASCFFLGKKTTRLISNQPPSLLALIHRKTRAVCICYCLLSTITGGGDCLDRLLTRLKLPLLFGSCIFFFSFSVCLHPSSIFVASLLLLILLLLLLLLLLSRRFSIYLFSSNGVELWWISSP